MKTLEEEIKAQKIETIRKDGMFRLLGIVVVVAAVYFAIQFVHADFKILTFLNPWASAVMQLIGDLLYPISDLLRELIP